MDSAIVTPKYVSDFSCIGPDCEDSCCIGWNIYIDKKSYKKTMAHPQLKGLAKSALKKIKRSDDQWAIVRTDATGVCPFLDSKKLCKIHSIAGEETLSATCRTYPRLTVIREHDKFDSLSLSCPEAARLILFSPDAFIFERKLSGSWQTPHSSPLWVTKTYDYSIELLLNDKLNWQQALLTIGFLINSADKVWQNEAPASVLDSRFEQLSLLAEQGVLQDQYQSLSYVCGHQVQAFAAIHGMFIDAHPRRDGVRFGMINDAISAMLNDDETLDIERINRAWNDIASPALDEHGDIFKRYLLYYMYHEYFPTTLDDKPQSAFRLIVLDCFILRCYLAVIANKNNGLSESDIILCFQVYHVVRQHKSTFIKGATEIMEKFSFSNVAGIISLLKTQD
ncbi:flagellar biosynthesis protein, putative [Shewanella sediminis HAW-EB3]|uniref:Flagellar biosynthesis protein, putative n=1 Tax=Shewanella sediminis (strain HAW-EB3) TaxID=425104 RepID=A8G001_SHESH|nr:flagellin lysine-N-methylase [Shewanella sediminis]ABV38424.1 flagellar biosynthesis protein, putative [Shewanella sediminis HAW-EB3]